MLKPFSIILYPLFLFAVGYFSYAKAGLIALNALLIVGTLWHLHPLINKKWYNHLFCDIAVYIRLIAK